MAKDHFVACMFYKCEGNCARGRAGTFYKECQHCGLYLPLQGAEPAKKNLKREKRDAQRRRDERRFDDWE